ncbi:MAG: hypothetical protein JWN08_1308 [Frankiales bacterium]|nr:hypothetical protein [Frankiales bacterium]
MPLPPHLPESRLPDELAAQLPASTPPAPWDCRVRATIWVQRAPSPLPSSSPFAGRVHGVAVGMLVDYLESPVGPYREVLVGQLLRGTVLPVVHVPFIAVDSLPSVHGGREHWQLPKAFATFDGPTATGDGWSVTAQPRAYGLRFPVRGPFGADQGSGRATTRLHGTARLARVDVRTAGLTIGPWLDDGVRHGLVAEGRMVVAAPA